MATTQTQAAIQNVARVIRLPKPTWEAVKEKSKSQGTCCRLIIADAVAEHTPKLVDDLRALGMRAEVKCDKRVRTLFEPQVIDTLNWCREQTGIPAATFLLLALLREVGDSAESPVKAEKAVKSSGRKARKTRRAKHA